MFQLLLENVPFKRNKYFKQCELVNYREIYWIAQMVRFIELLKCMSLWSFYMHCCFDLILPQHTIECHSVSNHDSQTSGRREIVVLCVFYLFALWFWWLIVIYHSKDSLRKFHCIYFQSHKNLILETRLIPQ